MIGFTFGDVSIMFEGALLDFLLLHEMLDVDGLGLFEFVLFLFLDVLLHHCADLIGAHVIFYFFRKLVKDALVLDGHPQQCLFELLKVHASLIVPVHLLVSSVVDEYLG